MPEPAVARPWTEREALWLAYVQRTCGLTVGELMLAQCAWHAGWAAREQTTECRTETGFIGSYAAAEPAKPTD